MDILFYIYAHVTRMMRMLDDENNNNNNNIIMAGMAVFNVAGYLIEERRRWPVITASPRGQYSK